VQYIDTLRRRSKRKHRGKGIALAFLTAILTTVIFGIVMSRYRHVDRDDGSHVYLLGTNPSVVAIDKWRGQAFVTGYGASGRGQIWTLNLLTGHTAPITTRLKYPAGLAIDERLDRVFVVDGKGNKGIAIDTRSNTVLYTVLMGNQPDGVTLWRRDMVVCEHTERVFVANYFGKGTRADRPNSTITLFDALSGHVVRVVDVGQGLIALTVDERSNRIFALNSIDASVVVLDARNGTVRNVVRVGPNPLAMAVDERTARLFITYNAFPIGLTPGSRKGQVQVLDANTGRIIRTITVGSLPRALAIDMQDERVFVANSWSRSVSILNARTGQLVRTVAVAGIPVAAAVDAPTSRVFITISNTATPYAPDIGLLGVGRVVILDARSGTISSSIPAGVAPNMVQIDERARRAIVVNAGGRVPAQDRKIPLWPQENVQEQVAPSISVLDISRPRVLPL